MGQNRLIYLDLLRIASAFFVILIHVSASGLHEANVGTYAWNVCNVYDGISRFCVPVFVMISGAMLLDPKKEYTLKKLYGSKIVRIIIAVVFWGTIYALSPLCEKTTESAGAAIYQLLYRAVTGYFHMWFLFMICGLYMITPVLRRIVTDKKTMKYFLALSFAYSAVVMFALVALEELEGVNILSNLALEVLGYITDNMKLHFLLGYTFYFVMGYYIKEYGFNSKISKWVCVAGVLSLVFIIAGTYGISVYKNETVEILYEYNYLPVCILSVAIFLFFKNYISKLCFGEKALKIIAFIAKHSFGIYLVHMLVFKLLPLKLNSFNVLLSVPVITVLVFVISLAITFIIGKIPVLKKYVI